MTGTLRTRQPSETMESLFDAFIVESDHVTDLQNVFYSTQTFAKLVASILLKKRHQAGIKLLRAMTWQMS